MNQHFNQIVEAQLEAQRHQAAQAARPTFSTQTPAERAFELIARIEAAKLNKNLLAFDAAKAELATLIEEL